MGQFAYSSEARAASCDMSKGNEMEVETGSTKDRHNILGISSP